MKSPLGEKPAALTSADAAALQLRLALVDAVWLKAGSFLELIVFQRERIVIRMGPDKNHARPHFHIEYKQEHKATYMIDTMERKAGTMPRKYEEPMLDWARENQDRLLETWKALKRGEAVTSLLEAPAPENRKAVATTPKKRPRDPLQLAKLIGDIATGQVEDKVEDSRDPAAVALGRKGGLKGGRARAAALSADKRADIARAAVSARWKKTKD